MPDPSTLGVFLLASIALLVIPGPAVMYIVARGIHQGRSAALVSTLGIEVGTFIQLLLATARVPGGLVGTGFLYHQGIGGAVPFLPSARYSAAEVSSCTVTCGRQHHCDLFSCKASWLKRSI